MNGHHPSEAQIFEQALQLSGDDRTAYLVQACGGDDRLHQRIAGLLAAHQSADDGAFMDKAPAASAKTLVITTGMIPITEKAGDKIGRYKLREQIGEGGCGVVYVAEQEEPMRRRVALKVIKLGMDTKQVVARFEAERQALALMDHPNIAKVLDAGATDTGRPYFVMELVRGIKITAYCDQNNLSTEERLKLFIQVCSAIQHAHQKGIIHRDIKPSNILVTHHDGVPVPKVIDFGIAKATTDQRLTDKTVYTAFEQFLGTPAYMSPEQAEMSGLDIDTRSDIYSLGVLLYELLTGHTPFDAATLLKAGLDQMRRIIREQEPQRPSTRLSTLEYADLTAVANHRHAEAPKLLNLIRGDLDWIVMKALEKDRTRRYETVNALAMDAKRHLENDPILARPPSQLYRLQKLVRRNKLAVGAAGAVVASLVFGLALATRNLTEARNARFRAEAAEAHEQQLRLQAEVGKTEEQRLRKEAEIAKAGAKASERNTRTVLAASDFREAAHLIEQNNYQNAIPYLARILSQDPTDAAALTRLTTLLTYHSWMPRAFELVEGTEIWKAQFSPDGKQILTLCDDGGKLWDAQTGKGLTKLDSRTWDYLTLGTPSVASFENRGVVPISRDGRRMPRIYRNTAIVWDGQALKELTKPFAHLDSAGLLLGFSPDGKRAIASNGNGVARIWSLEDGRAVGLGLKYRDGMVPEFSSDGKWVVTKSVDRTAQIWDAETGKALIALEHTGEPISAQFSPDANCILTVTASNVLVWDARTGKELATLKHSNKVLFALFGPDGKQVVTGSENVARLWDARTGELLALLKHSDGLRWAEFNSDGKRILTISYDHAVRVWNAETGKELTQPLRHAETVESAHFNPDGSRIITVSGKVARVWDAPQIGGAIGEPLPHSSAMSTVQFSPDGKRIVSASGNSARVWNARTGEESIALNQTNQVTSAKFSPDGKLIVTVSANAAQVWHAETGRRVSLPLKHLPEAEAGNFTSDTFPVCSAQFSPDGKRVVTTSDDNTARIWDALTGKLMVGPMNHAATSYVNSAQFSPDGGRLVTGSDDGTARVWDARTGRELLSCNQVSPVFSAQFSPDGNWILTINQDDVVTRLWDSRTGTEVAALNLSREAVSAQFSPDGKRIVTASWDGTRVWDAQTRKELIPRLKGTSVYSAQFSPDGRRIVTASWNSIRIWDVQTGRPLTEALNNTPLNNEPVNIAPGANLTQFSPDGTRIVTAPAGHTAQVWDIAPGQSKCPDWLLLLAGAIAGEILNEHGLPEPIEQQPAEILNQIRTKLDSEPDHDEWVVWGRWLLANPLTRTISPLSSVTVPQYLEDRIKGNSLEALEEVAPLAFGNEKLIWRVEEATKRLRALREADMLLGEVRRLQSENKNAEAEKNSRRALEIRRRLLGNENAQVVQSLVSLADVLIKEKKFAEAELPTKEALELRRRLVGNEHEEVAESLASLADILFGENKFAEAESPANEALELQRKLHGNNSAQVAQSMTTLASILAENGKLDEAERLAKGGLEIRQKLSGNQDVAGSLARLAAILLRKQNYIEAEPVARECLAIREKEIPDNWLTFNARSLLGGSLLGQKKHAEAEPFLRSGYEGIKARKEAASEIRLNESLQRLVQLYEATGRSREAAELRKELPAYP